MNEWNVQILHVRESTGEHARVYASVSILKSYIGPQIIERVIYTLLALPIKPLDKA